MKSSTASRSSWMRPWKKWLAPGSTRMVGAGVTPCAQASTVCAGTTSSASPCTSSHGQGGGGATQRHHATEGEAAEPQRRVRPALLRAGDDGLQVLGLAAALVVAAAA